jgi:carbamate kinase
MPCVVIALGGNALSAGDADSDYAHQYATARAIAEPTVTLARSGWSVVLVHGNGPQVGNLAIQQEEALDLVPALPLFSLDGMTQGQLGSLLSLALLDVAGWGVEVSALVSHVVVRGDDPAFVEPTKPIGPFFTAADAERLASERGWIMREDAGRGFRRVVPSPRPIDIVEIGALRHLARPGAVVIACGGGGIPVVRANGRFEGVDAVIDKDLAAQLAAILLDADALQLVTSVPTVQIDYGTPRSRELHDVGVDEAERYLADEQFPPGSMGPKVLAATQFVRARGRAAVITSPERMLPTLLGEADEEHTGTRIVPAAASVPA